MEFVPYTFIGKKLNCVHVFVWVTHTFGSFIKPLLFRPIGGTKKRRRPTDRLKLFFISFNKIRRVGEVSSGVSLHSGSESNVSFRFHIYRWWEGSTVNERNIDCFLHKTISLLRRSWKGEVVPDSWSWSYNKPPTLVFPFITSKFVLYAFYGWLFCKGNESLYWQPVWYIETGRQLPRKQIKSNLIFMSGTCVFKSRERAPCLPCG